MKSTQRFALVTACTLGTIGCDHATKRWAIENLQGKPGQSFLGGVIQLRFAENQGGFLSLGASMSEGTRFVVFTLGVGLLLFAMLGMALWSKQLRLLEILGISALAAGGLSNWIDRATNDGKVVDFLILKAGPLRTGIFNVADVVIMAAIPLLLWASRSHGAKEEMAVALVEGEEHSAPSSATGEQLAEGQEGRDAPIPAHSAKEEPEEA